jgi:hypothetical protein
MRERRVRATSVQQQNPQIMTGVHEELHQTSAHASVDNGLDLVVAAIGQIREGPAGIDEHLLVSGVEEIGEGWEGRAYELERGLRLATAEVGKSPGGVPEHGELGRLCQVLQEGTHGAVLKDVVAALRRIASNATQSLDSLAVFC